MRTSTGVCIVVPELDRIGGYELAAGRLARSLAARGIPVVVVTQQCTGPRHLETGHLLEVIRLTVVSRYTLLSLLPALFLVLVRRRSWIRVLHCQTFGFLSGLAVLCGHILGIPTVVRIATQQDVQSFAMARDQKHRLFFSVLRTATRFVALSRAIVTECARCRLPTARTRLIPNGVDADHYRPPTDGERSDAKARRGIRDHVTVVGTLARLVPRKRIDLAIRAYAVVAAERSDVALCIVGEGPERGRLEELAATLRLRQVQFAGTGDSREWLATFDVFAFPSMLEGSPNAVLEAMAMAIPSVAFRIGGVNDALEDEVSGLLCHEGDEAGFTRGLERLVNDRDLRLRLGAAARARIERVFSSEAVTSDLVSLYEECRPLVRLSGRGA